MFNERMKMLRLAIAADPHLVGRRNSTIKLLAFFGLLAFGRLATAETLSYEIVPSESRYTFLPGGFRIRPSVFDDCQPRAFECDFGIEGLLTLQYNLDARTAGFQDVTVDISGNDHVLESFNLVSDQGLAELLSGLSLMTHSADAGITVFRQRLGFNFIDVTVDGNELRILGGRDDRPVDGNGYEFDVRAIAVPEPHCVMLCVIGALQLVGMMHGFRPARPSVPRSWRKALPAI